MPLHPALAAMLTQTVLHAPYTGQDGYGAVSYTHLTLPTNREV